MKGRGAFASLACLTTLEGVQSQAADEADGAGPPSSCQSGEMSMGKADMFSDSLLCELPDFPLCCPKCKTGPTMWTASVFLTVSCEHTEQWPSLTVEEKNQGQMK